MSDRDVIIVGGGHNGLICAAYLARAGLDTLVLEARPTVGGCASTVEAFGARVNICNCDHLMVRATPIAEELELAGHGLDYLDVDPAYVALSWHGGTPWALYHDADRTIEALTHTRPHQAAAYARYLEDALPAARLVANIAGDVPRPGLVIRSLADAGRRSAQVVLRWSRRSALEILPIISQTRP